MIDFARPWEQDVSVEQDTSSRRSSVGNLIVLVGVIGWVVSCFLPLYRLELFDRQATTTLYKQLVSGSIETKVGGFLYLFGGIAAIAVFAVLAIRGAVPWAWSVLAGTVVGWTFSSAGLLITTGGIGHGTPRWSLGVGYWTLWASVTCVVIGTAGVLFSRRHAEPGVLRSHELGHL